MEDIPSTWQDFCTQSLHALIFRHSQDTSNEWIFSFFSLDFGYIIVIGVAVPAGFIMCVCGIILCVVVYCFGASRHTHTTATFPTQPVTTTTFSIPTISQEDGFQAHPAARTDVSQVPPHEISTNPPKPHSPTLWSVSPPTYSPPPYSDSP